MDFGEGFGGWGVGVQVVEGFLGMRVVAAEEID